MWTKNGILWQWGNPSFEIQLWLNYGVIFRTPFSIGESLQVGGRWFNNGGLGGLKLMIAWLMKYLKTIGQQQLKISFSYTWFKIHFWVFNQYRFAMVLGNQFRFGIKVVTSPICLQVFDTFFKVTVSYLTLLLFIPLSQKRKNVFQFSRRAAKLLAHSNWNFWSFQTQNSWSLPRRGHTTPYQFKTFS